MLHDRQDDLVPRAEVGPPPGISDEIYCFCRIAGENEAVCVWRLDEAGDFDSRLFVGGRGLLGETVEAAVNIGIVVFVIANEGIDHDLRLLSGRGIIEVHEGYPMHLAPQDGKVLADSFYVKHL
jgi:hypothetical protein